MKTSQFAEQPDRKVCVYRINDETGYYELKGAPQGFDKLPAELKVEETRRPDKIRSKLICRGRIRNGSYTFFTGLLPVEANSHIYFGDHYHPHEEKKNSFIIFWFGKDKLLLTVHYFNHLKVYPGKRGKFISDFLNSLS